MGEFLVAPIVIFVIAVGIWVVYFSRSRADQDPAQPENAPHPARHG